MAKYKDKWKTTFPASIGNQTRPEDGVDNTQEYNTDGLPQYMANDPVRYDLQNAVNSQLVSNDERLNEKIERTSDDLAAHNKDPKAHATGIAGNAATASKLLTPRTISLTGKAAGSASFDGSANAAINVTSVNADTASKLSTARKINITGNATGAAAFDGSGDANISVTVNESKHAAAATTVNATAPNGGAADLAFGTMAINDYARIRVYGKDDNGALEIATADAGTEPIYARQYAGSYDWINGRPGTVINEAAILDGNGNTKFPKNVTAASFTGPLNGTATKATQDANGRAFTDTNAYMHISTLLDGTDFNNIKTTGIYLCNQNTYTNRPHNAWGILTVYSIGTVKQEYRPDNAAVYYTREYNNSNWTAWSKVAASTADTCTGNSATATKLQTPRTISLTGNASGSAAFDGSGNVSINTNVNYAAQAARLADESGNNYIEINSTTDSWSVIGANPGKWLKSVRTKASAPPYSIGNFSAAVAFGGGDTKGVITHAYDGPMVKFAGGNGSTANWKFSIQGGSNNEVYNLNNFPTKTGGGASGTWGINISGTATNADKLDGYHASDIIGKIYPVGSIYMSMSATNPATLFGVGTWARISQGRFLLGADDSTYKAGGTGGEATHTLTAEEMPAHSHGMDGNGNHRHYIANTDENSGGWLGNNAYLEHKYTDNSYENFELMGTGRDATVGLTSQSGWHTHNINNTGGGAAHNNMPPYLVCYIWQRTA